MNIEERMVGARIISVDGEEIGTVKEVRGGAFKVDAPLQFDFWLERRLIDSADMDRVILTIRDDEVEQFKLENPDNVIRVQGIGDDPVVAPDSTRTGMHEAGGRIESVSARDRGIDDMGLQGERIKTREVSEAMGVDREGTNANTVGTGTTWTDVAPRFRDDWHSIQARTGTWEEYEPGFHFGYEMAHDPRFRAGRWEDVEPTLQAEYGGWHGHNGATQDEGAWDHVKDSVRHAWDQTRGQRRAA